MKSLIASLFAALLSLVLLPQAALALDGKITKVDPPSAKQGQTVMLTVSGTDLPQGGVSLDFFPQRIQLVKVLSASADEIVAQIRIPQTAPAGDYNILVYNHLGEEAFAEKMFRIDSDLVVPVVTDYDPKVIAEADNGFALLLTCDGMSEAAAGHLNIEWSKGALELRRLQTVFSCTGPTQVVAAVSGALPEGSIRGRLMFDSTPIYLIELTIRSSKGAYVLGFSPAELEPVAGQRVRLIGSGFDQAFLDGLNIQLLHDEQPLQPSSKRLEDATSIILGFDMELAPGRYTLIVRQADETLLLEDLTVKAAGLITQPTQNGVANVSGSDPQTDGGDPGQGNAATESGGLEPAGGNPAAWQPRNTSPAWSSQADPDLISLNLASSEMEPGGNPARFTLQGSRLSELDADNLSYSLQRQSGESELLFSGFTNNGITCIFGPEGEDWHAGERLLLRIVDAANSMSPFSTELELGISGVREMATSAAPGGTAENRISGSAWEVELTSFTEGATGMDGTVHLRYSGEQPVLPALLSGSWTFIPDNPNYSVAFSNISYAGDLALSGAAENWTAQFSGLFVPGIVELTLHDGPDTVLATDIAFDFPAPAARLQGSAEGLNLDPQSLRLDRENLVCSVDFTPFIPNSADIVRASLLPAPAIVQALPQNTLEGSIVRISAPTGQWDSAVDFGAGLQLRLDAGIELGWPEGQVLIFPVGSGGAVEEALSVEMPKRPVVMEEQGFSFTLQPRGKGSERVDWTRVKLSSDNMLLNNNIDSFAVSATAIDFLGEPAVSLVFRRGRGLSQEAFDALADQLVDAGEIPITLYWDEIRYSFQGSVDFVR
ncbi:MAG: hypothetical protein R3F46_16175 [bacterium]